MKKILLGSIATLALVACSNDEVVLENNDANAINFAVSAEGTSRATDVYCPNNIPGTFYVWADFVGTTTNYIIKDEINYAGGKCTNASGMRYWPNEGKLGFYGIVNGEDLFDLASKTVKDFEVAANVADQKDLLYAVNKGTDNTGLAKQGATTPNVAINFQHALSQVVFKAANESNNLYVEINSVGVAGICGKGTYTLPTATTSNRNDICPEGTPIALEDATEFANSGEWTLSEAEGDVEKAYTVTFAEPIKLAINKGTVVNLTEAISEADFSKAMLLLPQKLDPRYTYETEEVTEKTGEKDEDGNEITKTYTKVTSITDNGEGFYFTLNCKIYNVAGDEFNKDTDVCLWNGSDKNLINVPATINWFENYKYIYTFRFGDGTAGIIPGDVPQPVLVPITFDVDVEQFKPVDGGNHDIIF